MERKQCPHCFCTKFSEGYRTELDRLRHYAKPQFVRHQVRVHRMKARSARRLWDHLDVNEVD